MKKTIASFILLFFIVLLKAQVNYGLLISNGLGEMNSRNFQKNLDYQKSLDPTIYQWKENNSLRYNFAVGGFIQFDLAKHFVFLADATFNSLSSRFELIYLNNNYYNTNNFHVITNGENETIDLLFLGSSALIKYKLKDRGLYFLAGMKFSYNLSSKINSTGTRYDGIYNNGIQEPFQAAFSSLTAKLDSYKKFNMHLTAGIGYTFMIWKRELSVDLRYNLPVTESSLYTNNENFNSTNSENRKLIGLSGKEQAETIAPQYLLNDFKVSYMQLSLAYCFLKK